MNKFVIFQSIVFISFLTYSWLRVGIKESISALWYALGKQSFLFTLFTWGVGLPMILLIITDQYSQLTDIFLFLSGAFLCFVGAATEYKERTTDIIHYVGATGAIVFGFAANLSHNLMWQPVAMFIVGTILLKLFKVSNFTTWIEILAFILVIYNFL